jgi:hypothetical protein
MKEVNMADATPKAKSTRRTYRNDEWTEEQVKAKRAELTVAEIPAGWVKVADVGKVCHENSIPVSKFVRAFGGDRGMLPPANPIFRFVYVGRTRYVAAEALTQGISMLKDPNFLKTTRVRKPKGEKAEKAETGPVASAKPEGRRVAVRPAQG